jgi:glyoxylase-like metal-dependent hydrolase (beta-lactamase superfamily II)
MTPQQNNPDFMKKIVFGILLISSVFCAAQQNMDTVTIRPTKIKDNLYMLMGSGGNMGLLIGTDGSLLIDDQFAPLSDKIKTAVQKLGGPPVKYLINTHLHGDHSGGNENFKKDGTTIIAQENVRSRMMKPSTNRQGQTNPPRDQAAWPLVTFTESVQLHLNGEDVEVIHFKQKAHTDGDAIIRFVNANVFHTGDGFVRYGYPYIDVSNGGSFKGFIANLDKMIEVTNDQSIIIPGHGLLATRADIKALREKLSDIGNKVADAVKKGKKIEDIPSLGITDPYDAELGKGFLKGKDFVTIIAQELSASK